MLILTISLPFPPLQPRTDLSKATHTINMAERSEVQRLKEDSDIAGLIALKRDLKGPVQQMQVNSALAEVLGEEERWDEAAEAWRECLAISPANPELWERLGDAAEKAGSLSLAISSLQSSFELSRDLAVLLKLAQIRLRLHDYSNALVLAAFVRNSQPWNQDADQLHSRLLRIMQGKELFNGGLIKKREDFSDLKPEKVVIKVANLLGVAKSLRRQLETGKDDVLLLFQKVPIKDPVDPPPPRPPTKKGKSALLQLHQLCEDIKKEALAISEPAPLPLFGLNPMPAGTNFKTKCMGERGLERFLEGEWKVGSAVKELISSLCANSPRPSPSLSDELAWETLHLYLVSDPPLPLSTELLTLFELSLKDNEHLSTLHRLHEAVLERKALFAEEEMVLRLRYAEAWFYYHIGEEKTKDMQGQVEALVTAYALLEELERNVGEKTYYFWWYGKVLSSASIQTFKDNIKDELLLVKVEESLRLNPKASAVLLDLLSALCALLKKRCAKDDPAFYWRKVRTIVKSLGKATLTQEEQFTYSLCLAEFLGVLQYNLEDGSRLSKDIDLRFLFKTAYRYAFSKHPLLRKAHEAYITVSIVNIVKARPELFIELPFLVKKVMLSSESLTQYFLKFHLLCSDYASVEKDFHYSLCRTYEKPAALCGNVEAMNIVYAQLYGFTIMHKECPCKLAKILTPETSFPKSIGKLQRMLSYIHLHTSVFEEYGVYYPQTLDKDLSPGLERCYLRLPDLHLNCPLFKQAKDLVLRLIVEGPGGDIHQSCGCRQAARPVAEAFLQRYAADCFELALMKETQSSFLSLLEGAETVVEKLLVVNPGNPQGWLLLGQISLHKWMAGYYDSALVLLDKPEYAHYADLSLRCFAVLETLEPRAYGYIQLVRGLIGFLRYRLSGQGLEEAETSVSLALIHSPNTHSVETLMILALIHLHTLSPSLPQLLSRLNQESHDKYLFLTLVATYKNTKSMEVWGDSRENRELYVSYVKSKRQPAEYREEMMGSGGFYSAGKLFETKVMDRCVAFGRKKVKVAARYVEHYFHTQDLLSLFALCRDLSTQAYPLYKPVFLLSLSRLSVLFQGLSSLPEVKSLYEFLDFLGGADIAKEVKDGLVEEMTQALGKYAEVFGAEQCEAQKPSKRRRKK